MLYKQKIPASGRLIMPVAGRAFLLDKLTTSPSVTVVLQRDRREVLNISDRVRGFSVFEPEGFNQVEIIGTAADEIWFAVENSQIKTNTTEGSTVQVGGVVTVSGVTLTATNVGISPPDTLTDIADVPLTAGVATLIRAASANTQNEIIIKNLSANAEAIRIGSATITATRGHELQPGETLTISTKGAVYGYSASAQSVSVVINSKV